MIRINQLKLNIAHTQSDLERKILKTLHMKKEYLQGYKIRRQSIDARKKPDLYYVYSVDVLVKDEAKIKKSIKSNQIQFQAKEDAYNFPANGTREFKHRPVIIGTGPAGLFCGYMLAIHGYRPILLERGADVDQRTKDVETFWKTGTLDPSVKAVLEHSLTENLTLLLKTNQGGTTKFSASLPDMVLRKRSHIKASRI